MSNAKEKQLIYERNNTATLAILSVTLAALVFLPLLGIAADPVEPAEKAIDWTTVLVAVAGALATVIVATAGAVAPTLIAIKSMKDAVKTAGQDAQIAASNAANAASEVKATLAVDTANTTARMESLAKVAKDTHTLVNSNMEVQLNLNRAMARRLAALPNAPAEDIEAAKHAELMYQEHVKKQAIVDGAK